MKCQINEDKLEAVRLIDASIPRGSRWNYSNSFIGDDVIIEVSRCSDGIVYINHISFETLKMPVLRFLDRADRCT